MLQILVNHFNEDRTIVKQFLSSLEIQKDINFEVFIQSDGGEIKLNNEDFKDYSFPIYYTYEEHIGVCRTRNALMDKATSEYIMFCDIDDCFCNEYGLLYLANEIKNKYDIIGSSYLMEVKKDEQIKYLPYKKDLIRLHSKLFRRQYLIDNNIRYPKQLKYCGDMAFLYLAYSLTTNIIWLDTPVYIWKWNEHSVTEHDIFFSVRKYYLTMDCYDALAKELKERKLTQIYTNLIASLFSLMYVDSHGKIYQKAPIEYQQVTDDSIKHMINKYYKDFEQLDKQYILVRFQAMIQHKRLSLTDYSFEEMLQWAKNIYQT